MPKPPSQFETVVTRRLATRHEARNAPSEAKGKSDRANPRPGPRAKRLLLKKKPPQPVS